MTSLFLVNLCLKDENSNPQNSSSWSDLVKCTWIENGGKNRKELWWSYVIPIGHALRNYKYDRIGRDLNSDFNNSDFNTCDDECFVDLVWINADRWATDLWAWAGFHTKHNCSGGCWALASVRHFGWDWWLNISDQKAHFQGLFFSPLRTQQRLGGQLWQKQRGDFCRYCRFCLKIPEVLLPFSSQARSCDLYPGYRLTLLVWCPEHLLRTWPFIQRKILLKTSSQESLRWNRWDAVSSGGSGMSRRALLLPLLPAVFLGCLSATFPLLQHEEKEKHWQSESWKLQVFSGQNWGERWKKPGTFLGQVLIPCACHAGSEEHELLLFGCVT